MVLSSPQANSTRPGPDAAAAAFGRLFSDKLAGIAPAIVPVFVPAELVGAESAVVVVSRLLMPNGCLPDGRP